MRETVQSMKAQPFCEGSTRLLHVARVRREPQFRGNPVNLPRSNRPFVGTVLRRSRRLRSAGIRSWSARLDGWERQSWRGQIEGQCSSSPVFSCQVSRRVLECIESPRPAGRRWASFSRLIFRNSGPYVTVFFRTTIYGDLDFGYHVYTDFVSADLNSSHGLSIFAAYR